MKRLAILAAVLAVPLAANARSTFLSAFNTKYGTGGSVLDTCNTCHPNGTSSFNGYGNALIAANISSNATAALTAVEPLDSDGDGYTNKVEIDARSFPGLASSVPTAKPVIAVAPTSLSFGTVTVGSPASQSVTVSNTGNASLTVSSIARCTGTSTEFTASPASLTVAAGGRATVTVTYAPSAAGSDSGCFQLANNSATPSVTVNVSGTGQAPVVLAPVIAAAPTSLSFGTVTVGNTSQPQTVTVSNTGNASLTVSSIARCTGTSTEFTASPASLTVAAGGQATVTVTYAPTAAGTDSGCFQLANNSATPSVTVNVSGTGEAPVVLAPKIAVAPTSLPFGTVDVGSARQQTTTVSNTGNADLTVSAVSLCTGTSSEFIASPTGPFTVVPGASQAVTVTYSPIDAGADSGCVAVASDDATAAAVEVAVSGAGQAVSAPVVDVDITRFSVARRLDVSRGGVASPTVSVVNAGTVAGEATVGVVGVDAELRIVYSDSQAVTLAPGATAKVKLGEAAAGNLIGQLPVGEYTFTATITDDDGDTDVAAVTVKVVP